MNVKLAHILTVVGSLYTATTAYAEQVFQHQGKPPQLIELYTSEGCSSCPPADQFLGKFLENPRLWKDIVPIAFHVDYWDYLGWKDPFAQTKFKEQQYSYRRNGNIKSVYTPGWLVNGEEWRGFFQRRTLPLNTLQKGGQLHATLNNLRVNVTYKPLHNQNQLTAHSALIGFNHKSQVTAGENNGRSFTHQFVVLDKQSKQQDKFNWTFSLPEMTKGQRYALAVWITAPNLKPLQVTAGWIK